jgi:hypothetical protein
MKKKIEALLSDGALAGNAGFEPLHKPFQSAKRALAKAQKEKSEAKNAYRDALGQGEKDHDRLLELLTAYRQAKFMQRYHRAGQKLAKHRLHRWVEDYLKTAEVPHEPAKSKVKKAKPASAKAAADKASGQKKAKTSSAPAKTSMVKQSKKSVGQVKN